MIYKVMEYDKFYAHNKKLLQSGRVEHATIEDRRFKEGTCTIKGKSINIEQLVKMVLSNQICLTNPSQLKLWRGFTISNNNANKNNIFTGKGLGNNVDVLGPNVDVLSPDYKIRKNIDNITQGKIHKDEKKLSSNWVDADYDDAEFILCFRPKNPREASTIDTYKGKAKANKRLSLFKTDKSGYYRTIALIEKASNTVHRVLYFDGDSDVCTLDLTKDDIVRLKAVFCVSEKERRYLFSVKNINDIAGSVEICLLKDFIGLGSIERVPLNTIVPTGTTISDVIDGAISYALD